MNNQLTLSEEIFSLAVGETDGSIAHTSDTAFKVALASAVLIDLSLHERIDIDLEGIFLGNTELTLYPDLDMALTMIAKVEEKKSVAYWVEQLIQMNDELIDILLNALFRRGILKIEDKQVLWVFSARRYPLINNREVIEVKQRVRNLILSDDLPDVRDMSIVSVLFYSGTIDMVFDEEEIIKYYKRIEMIAKMDLIGQQINETVKSMTSPRQWLSKINK